MLHDALPPFPVFHGVLGCYGAKTVSTNDEKDRQAQDYARLVIRR